MRYLACSVLAWLMPVVALGATVPVAAPAAPAASAAPAQPEIGKSFQRGMAYSRLRQQLLDAGWLPLREPKCWDNVGGENTTCNRLQELQTCGAGDRCVMRFASRDQRALVRVDTVGPYRRMPGESSALRVESWAFAGLDGPATALPVACPSADFDTFLKAFASDETVRRAFIAPLVKVAELQSDDDGDHVRQVYVAAADYRAFNVDYGNGTFHFVDDAGKMDPSALRLSVARDGAQARTVRYLYGMSEGRSYRFQNSGGCWHLTDEPQPPSS